VTIGSYFLISRNSEKPTGRLQLREKGHGGLRNRNVGKYSDNVEGGSINIVDSSVPVNPSGRPVSVDAPGTSGSSPAVDREDDTILEPSTSRIINVSSDSSKFVFSEDNPNFKDLRDRERVSESDSNNTEPDLDSDDDFMSDADLPGAKRMKGDVKGKRAKVDGIREKYKKNHGSSATISLGGSTTCGQQNCCEVKAFCAQMAYCTWFAVKYAAVVGRNA
jgi:hypothetical protein